jgi:GNAT superfamily N-acetyltransferase
MTTIVIMPGGFHPFHAGHYALYKSAVDAFPDADVYVAATNDTSARPFPFAIKEKLAKLAGVAPNRFVQVKSPFKAEEVTARYNPEQDTLIFVRSDKDRGSPPRPGGVKKDGSPSYLQPWTGKNVEPFAQHAYMAYLPTVEFGPGMTSATEIRGAWPRLNDKRKQALVMSLYPRTQANPKLAATVVKLLDTAMGTELNEFAPSSGDGGDEKSYLLQLADDLGNALYGPNKNKQEIENIMGKIRAAGGDVKISWNNDSTMNVVMYHPVHFKQGYLIRLVGRGDQGVAEGSLNEFAPGGDSASSYYAVTANFVNDFSQQKQEELQDLIDAGWTKQDLAQAGTLQSQAADIAHFEQVRDGFLKGLKTGFDAYLQGDTQLKDQLGSYWQENDLPLNQDWEKIYGEPWGRDEYDEGVTEGLEYADKLSGLVDLPVFTSSTNPKGTAKVVNTGDRIMVVMNVLGVNVPYYISTGGGGKASVPTGKWYPVFGRHSSGWLNKGGEDSINKFYGSKMLALGAARLNNALGDLSSVEAQIPFMKKTGDAIINKDLQPMGHSEVSANPDEFKKRVNAFLAKLGSEPFYKVNATQPQGVAETINSAILNPRFKHKQKIGDYTYTATAEDFEGAPLLWIKAYDGNKEIGHILFEIIVRSPGGRRMPSADYLESGGTEVDPAYRNKGIASTMYAYAKMLGNDIRASYNQTSQGKAMWAAWEKAGDAKHLIGTAAESAVGENQGWAATLEESTGQVLDLTKNFSNHQRVHAKVVDVLPSGKVKLRVVVADAVPGKKPTVAVGQALSMAVNYLRRAPRVTEAENIKVEPVAKSLRIQNTQTQTKQNVYVAPDKKKTPAVVNHIKTKDQPTNEDYIDEKWSDKYKQSINCDRPQGFSQRAHCAGRKK